MLLGGDGCGRCPYTPLGGGVCRVEPPQEEHTVDALASEADEGRGQATKRLGEPRAGNDPRMSEWGNPAGVIPGDPPLNT